MRSNIGAGSGPPCSGSWRRSLYPKLINGRNDLLHPINPMHVVQKFSGFFVEISTNRYL
jgi:hypothetical protein